MIDLGQLYGPLEITASLVVDAEGHHVGSDGTSKSLGGEVDLKLLKSFRANAGAVLTTGTTARAEDYKLPSSASLYILSRGAKEQLPLQLRGERVTLIGNDGSMSLAEVFASLSDRGVSRIHVEFGPSTLLKLIDTEISARIFVSSESANGAAKFCSFNNLQTVETKTIDYLYVTELAGRA